MDEMHKHHQYAKLAKKRKPTSQFRSDFANLIDILVKSVELTSNRQISHLSLSDPLAHLHF